MHPQPYRRDKLRSVLLSEKLDALLISHPVNVTYLTGFSGDSTMLVLLRDREILVSDPRYIGQLADECPDVPTHIRSPLVRLQDAVAGLLASLGCRSVGCESSAITLAEAEVLKQAAPTISWVPASDRVENLRMVKDATEIAAIREAVAIAERAFAAFRPMLRLEDCEKDLADAMEGLVRRCGGLGCCFPPIIAVGERAALPHCPPTAKCVRESDLLLVDWGATGPSHYKSDLTRVLRVDRKESSHLATLREIHALVWRAQQAAIQAVRPGVVAKDVDAAARKVIADAGHGEHFAHGLGHGIGLQVHEAPSIRGTSDTVLTPGMIFTIEPGIYLPGWGGVRLEDDVLVTPDGCEVLTRVPRELDALAVPA